MQGKEIGKISVMLATDGKREFGNKGGEGMVKEDRKIKERREGVKIPLGLSKYGNT